MLRDYHLYSVCAITYDAEYSAAPDLLALVLDPAAMARTRERHLLQFLLAEAPDPNRKRHLLPERTALKMAA